MSFLRGWLVNTENKDHLLVLADPQRKNKGGDAARAALHMLFLKKKYIT